MSGWTHDALPDGMVYEGVPTAGGGGTISGGGQWRRERYFGETGAQSSVLPALDAALGIAMEEDELTPYLRAMLGYMPPKHSEFLSALASGPPIRTLVLEAARIDTSEALRVVEAYNSCLLALAEFRGCHLELAHSFVRAFDERKDEDIRGTGGTPFMPYLRKHWRGTSRLIVPAEGARQEA